MRISALLWQFALLAIFSYLIGSMNFAVLISRAKNNDIRSKGSGNPGTLNISRTFGIKTGLLTFFLDVVKGAIPTLVGFLIYGSLKIEGTSFFVSDISRYVCGFFVVLGHIYPIYYKFKGGKGIASTIGVFLVCEPIAASISLLCALGFILSTELGSIGSLIAITPPAISALINLYNLYYAPGVTPELPAFIITNMLILGVCFLTWYAHRMNIRRLLEGNEHPTSLKKIVKK